MRLRRYRWRDGERGSALLITTVLLLLIGLFGMAALSTVSRDQQVAGFQKRTKQAFYAAEAGVAKALETLTTGSEPVVPTTNVGEAGLFRHGQPSYRADTTATDATEALGVGAFPGMSLNLGQGGEPTYMLSYWRIRVEGLAPGGSLARIETVAGALSAH
jgi:Tfp pilus assembly protein PilX